MDIATALQLYIAAHARRGMAASPACTPSANAYIETEIKRARNFIGCLLEIKEDPSTIRHLKNPEFELALAAVMKDGMVIRFLPDQPDEVTLAAVKQNGLALVHCKNRDTVDGVNLAAVQQNGLALAFVRNKTPEICNAAVQQNPDAVEYVPPGMTLHAKRARSGSFGN